MGLEDRIATTPVLGTAWAVQQRYKRDGGDPLAAGIAFFGFLSLFPLLALAVAAAGFVLQDPADQVELALRVTEAIPGFDDILAQQDGGGVEELIDNVVAQRGAIGLVGAATLLITGLKVVAAAMVATRVVLRGEVMSGVQARVRQVLALVGLGLLALASTAGSSLGGLAGAWLPAPLPWLLGFVASFVLDLALFLGAYRLLSPTAELTTRELVPGAILGASGWSVLKVSSATFVGGQVDDANAMYGALAGVIALLLLLYLAGRLYVYGAELSAVRAERRRGAPLVPPDERADEDDAAAAHDVPAAGGVAAADGAAAARGSAAVAAPVPVGAGGVTASAASVRAGAGAATGPSPEASATATAVGVVVGVVSFVMGWRLRGGGRPR